MKHLGLLFFAVWLTLGLQAQIPGTVELTATIAPAATNSPFGVQTPVYGTGGLLTGASSLSQLQDLNWYPLARRHPFMIGIATNTGAQYVNDLTLTNWYNTGSVSNMAHLRLIEPGAGGAVTVDSYYGDGQGGGGIYFLTNTVTGTNAYGGRVLALGGAKSWELTHEGQLSVLQFGAKNDNTGDQSAAIQAAIDFSKSTPLILPIGTYRVGSTLNWKQGSDGVTGRTLRGQGQMGTASLTPTTFQRSALMATHTNAIIDITGVGSQLSGISFIFANEPTTNDTSMNCIKIEGLLTWSKFEDLRFVNGFRAIHNPNNTSGQIFSCTFNDITIEKFVNTAIFQDAPGTQNIWNNVYIHCYAPVGLPTQQTETTSSISVLNLTNLVFTLTASFAGQFTPGMVVGISSTGDASIEGRKTVTDISATSITVAYQTNVSAPASAIIDCYGGQGRPNSYVIKQNTFVESVWNNLNIEWMESLGCLMGRSTVINGLHLEGINFSGATANWFKFQGPAVINGWSIFNSFVATNQTVYLFGQSGTNGFTFSTGGYSRDFYYNPGSLLYVFGTSGGTSGKNYFANTLPIESGQWNRVSYFSGTGYGYELVGTQTNGVLSLGDSSKSLVLDLNGGAAGSGPIRLTRAGIATNEITQTTGGVQLKDVAAGNKAIKTEQLIGGTQVLVTYGSTSGSSTPLSVRDMNETASGSNVAGSDRFSDSGSGTGTGTPSSYYLRVPTVTSSGSGSQSLSPALQLNMGSPSGSNTSVYISYYNGSAWVTGVRLSLTNIGGVVVPYIP